jgi:tripartite-type tricarboxylate transporter receptor subunit TctC
MEKEWTKNSLCLLSALALVVVGVSCREAVAQTKGEAVGFYKGATLRFIVPTNPGGIFDMLARQTAPYLEKHSGAKVIVENMPGAGGLLGGSYIYNTAKPDGLSFGIFNTTGMALFECLELPTVKYKLDRFTYLCRADMLNQMLFTSKASGFRNISDMQKSTKVIRVGATDPTSAAAVAAALMIEAFGLNAKIVGGYKGISEVWLALAAGRELEALIANPAGFDDYIKGNQVTVAAAWHHQRRPDFPDVPAALEVPGLKPEGRRLLEFGNFLADIGRMILAPPGVPEERRLFLERAFLASLNEPAMSDWAKKNDCNLAPLSSKGSKELVVKVMESVPKPERPKFRHMITQKYF